MATKTKVREITITDDKGTFSTFFKMFGNESPYDFEGLSALRKLLSNEKARILHTIKAKKPSSVYALAKLVSRNFKSVYEDVKLLERFGFIELKKEGTGKRTRLKPSILADTVHIEIKI
ncbi:MAG: hypothetical protein AABW79_04670 [Nanoarchaeota archaeon]